jgi:hypothetical protein
MKDAIAEAVSFATYAANHFSFKPDARTMRACQESIGLLAKVANKPIQKYYKDDQAELEKIDKLAKRAVKIRDNPPNDLDWAKEEINAVVDEYYNYLIDANIIRV